MTNRPELLAGAAIETPRIGVVNNWTSAVLGGIPILNTGDTTSIPMYWNLNLANKFLDLPNWPANTYCN